MFNKRPWRAYAVPCFISITAIAFGGFVGIASRGDPGDPPTVHAAAGTTQIYTQDAGAAPGASPTVSPTPKPLAPRLELRRPQAPPEAPPAPPTAVPRDVPPTPVPPAPTSLFETNQLIVYYGTPLAPGLGVLGTMSPQDLAQRLKEHARLYDDLNGDRKAVPTLDLIYGIVQSEPTGNGLYLSYLPDDRVEEYLRLAEEHGLQVILDLQIGRSTVAAEIAKIERFLLNPRVHVAIDPEYAVGPNGYPIHTSGVISGHDINGAQLYLQELTEKHNLPPKMLIVHQFMDGTIIEGEVTADLPNVDVVLNMDAFGDYPEKVKKYRHYMARPYAERRSFNIFLKQDRPVGTEQDVLALDPMPDMVMYQ
ncbi:MAG: hypothetical protein WD359_00200 [Dehalococcoidia bacterium]